MIIKNIHKIHYQHNFPFFNRRVVVKILELRILPDVVWLIVMGCMWGATFIVKSFDLPFAVRVSTGAILVALGLALVQVAGVSFRRARTTVNPVRPDSASSLVVSGVYRFSRNPIYLGMTLILLGWASFLMNALSFVLVAVFVGYITRFQIIPEERALSARFGADYVSYQAKVRRWL
jgi:protein-S-isoprenylcysteine O-methyltransferase Ste14